MGATLGRVGRYVRLIEDPAPTTIMHNAQREVAKAMKNNVVEEMDPAVLREFSKMVATKTERIDPYADEHTKESARCLQQFERLGQTVEEEKPPKGRATELALQRALGWRSKTDVPPVQQVAKDLDLDEATTRSLLLHLGTPQALTEKGNQSKIGTWILLGDASMQDFPQQNELPFDGERRNLKKEDHIR